MGGLLGGDDDDFEDEEEEEAVEKGEEQVCARVQPCRHTRALQLPQVFCERAVAPLHRPAAAFTAGSAPFAQACPSPLSACQPRSLPLQKAAKAGTPSGRVRPEAYDMDAAGGGARVC